MEAKSGVTTDFISKHDADQLGGSRRWFATRYDSSVAARPVMIHLSTSLRTAAAAASNQVVVTSDTLHALKDTVRGHASALAADRWQDPETMNRLLTGHKLRRADLARYVKNGGLR